MNPVFYKSQVGKYFVMQTYSRTDTRQLLRVMTRPIPDILSADVYRETTEQRKPKKQEVFLVKIVDENDAEMDLSKARNEGWHKGYEECLRRIKSGEIKI